MDKMEPPFLIIDCYNFKPHQPHEWREGFLWLRKRKCGGVPERRKLDAKTKAEIWDRIKPPELYQHRHFFKLTKVFKFRAADPQRNFDQWIDRDLIGWQCECEAWRVSNREHLRNEMVPDLWKGLNQTWPS